MSERLTWDEQRALFLEMRPPHSPEVREAARNQLALQFMGAAIGFASKMKRNPGLEWVDMPDLAGEAILRMFVALDAFDPHAGTKFCTFLACAVKRHLAEYSYIKAGHFDAPRRVSNDECYFRAAKRKLFAAGLPSSDDDVFASLGWGEKRCSGLLSFRRLRGSEWQSVSRSWSVANKLAAPVEKDDSDDKEEVERLLRFASPRQADIVRRVYGIGCTPLSMRKLGAEYGISYQAIGIQVQRFITIARKAG